MELKNDRLAETDGQMNRRSDGVLFVHFGGDVGRPILSSLSRPFCIDTKGDVGPLNEMSRAIEIPGDNNGRRQGRKTLRPFISQL